MGDTFKALTDAVRGRVVIASDAGYDDARGVHNAMHDRRPRKIVQCVDSANVMAAVAAARDAGLDLAIRGGRPPRSRVRHGRRSGAQAPGIAAFIPSGGSTQ